MINKRTLTVIAASVMVGAAVAGAMPFNNTPEQNAPAGGWQGDFPYQRNVYIGFCSDPATWPADPVNGYDLIPEVNCHHEGTDDPDLYDSDWISLGETNGVNGVIVADTLTGGPAQWFDDDPTGTSGRTGMVGFYMQEMYSVSMTVHLDNWEVERPYKNIWVEMEYYTDGPVSLQLDMMSSTGQMAYPQPVTEDLGGGWYRANCYVRFEPNPPWEELYLYASADPTAAGSVLIDYIHIATECVPEPASLAMLALGGLLIRRRRIVLA